MDESERLEAEVCKIIQGEIRQTLSDYGVDPDLLTGDPDHADSVRMVARAVIEAVEQSATTRKARE